MDTTWASHFLVFIVYYFFLFCLAKFKNAISFFVRIATNPYEYVKVGSEGVTTVYHYVMLREIKVDYMCDVKQALFVHSATMTQNSNVLSTQNLWTDIVLNLYVSWLRILTSRNYNYVHEQTF